MPSDKHLRAALLSYASYERRRAENLLSDDWHETYKELPTLRQSQYGMAVAMLATADELVSLLGIDPRSLWPTVPSIPPLPEEERSQLRWSR